MPRRVRLGRWGQARDVSPRLAPRPWTSRFIRPVTAMTTMMRIVQKAKALPKRPASTSERICDVMILVWGVVMKMIGDSVVMDRENA